MSLGVRERLIYFLENLAKRKGCRKENSVTIDCSLSAAEIANSICATRQSVSFHLRELKKLNWLKITRREMELSDLSFERHLQFRVHAQHLAA
jgi:CRP-like cAMP-binding protein